MDSESAEENLLGVGGGVTPKFANLYCRLSRVSSHVGKIPNERPQDKKRIGSIRAR